MVIQHATVIKYIEHYLSNDNMQDISGVCYGFSTKYIDAYLLNDRKSFYSRLSILEQYKNNIPQLFEEINRLRLQHAQGVSLTDRQRIILELPGFFEGVIIQQRPNEFKQFYKQSFFSIKSQQMVNQHSITKPELMNDQTLREAFETHHILTKQGLVEYLQQLKNHILQCDAPVAFIIRARS